jgi:peroxiredoxin Q/BCP
MINVGDSAPSFELADQHGAVHTLQQYAGRWVVLYFYPKDDTPGCTKEACSFRDDRANLEALGASVLGVSADDTASHAAFASKYSLNFPLLADPERLCISAYGAWGKKNMYGKEYEGVMRYTYLINPAGQVAHIWKKVNTEEHAQEVAQVLQTLL